MKTIVFLAATISLQPAEHLSSATSEKERPATQLSLPASEPEYPAWTWFIPNPRPGENEE